MGNVQQKEGTNGLSAFQRKKLKYEFHTFFDLNHDGCLTYNDFLWAKDKICFMSGWKIDSPKYKITEALFSEIWDSLERIADIDKDGKITKAEWLTMWAQYKEEIMALGKEEKDFLKNYYHRNKAIHELAHPAAAATTDGGSKRISTDSTRRQLSEDLPVELDSDEEPAMVAKAKAAAEQEREKTVLEQFASHETKVDDTRLPKWLYKYLVFRFNLLDRTGDNVIDNEEFEYVMSEFGTSERVARQAFTIFTQNGTKALDFDYFVQLFEEYYLSDDPSALGNFINGKLAFDEDENSDVEDPGRLDHHDHHKSSTSIHSMDDDLRPTKNGSKKSSSTIKLHQIPPRVCHDVKTTCCSVS